MHVVMFSDQHLDSLGGAQVSMRLQRRFLERAGHTVTVVAPAMHGPRRRDAIVDPTFVDTPSVPITADREYSLSLPGKRTDAFVDAAMSNRGPVDVVHVQADFWGAFTGYRFAEHNDLPVVHTMHNRVETGIAATMPMPGLMLRGLHAWARSALPDGTVTGTDGWAYLARLAEGARAVTAPSAHFASRLERHGVFDPVDVIWNGIDDDLLDAALAQTEPRRPGPARLVWLGRMSPEKRLLPFLRAVAASGIDAEVEVIGGGGQLRAAKRLVERAGPAARVVFSGRMPHKETLRRIADADVVVQTSVGFETQGMTVFEAAALGTPAIVNDPDIADELGSGLWRVGEGADETISSLAATLRLAVSEIDAGRAPTPDPGVRERFRQSSRTAAMVSVYQRVCGRG